MSSAEEFEVDVRQQNGNPDEQDFNFYFSSWCKQNDKRNMSAVQIRFNCSAYKVHKEVLTLGGYELVLQDKSHLFDKLYTANSTGAENRKNATNNRWNNKKAFRSLVETIQSFVEDYDWEVERSSSLCYDGYTPLDSTLNVLVKRLEEIADRTLNESILTVVKGLIRKLVSARKFINEDDIRSILWLGKTRVGKSFSLNLLLYISEIEPWLYGLKSTPGREFTELYFEKKESLDETFSFPTFTSEKLDFELLSLEKKANFIKILPEPGYFSSDSFRKLKQSELEYLRAIRSHAVDGTQKWVDFLKSRGNIGSGYFLESAAEQTFSSTTLHPIKIRLGTTWHFQVTYFSESEIKRKLQQYFDECYVKSQQEGEKNKNSEAHEVFLEEYMKKLLKILKGSNLSKKGSNRSSQEITKAAADSIEEEENDLLTDEEEYIPARTDAKSDSKKASEIKFQGVLSKLAGKTFLFVGEGKNSLEDRVYLRKMLKTVLFEGIETLTTSTKQASIHIIKEIEIFAPSKLLQDGVNWMDAPGTNDANPEKYINLLSATETCTGIILLSDMMLEHDSSLMDVFRKQIVPRFWEKGRDLLRLGNFLTNEQRYSGNIIQLALDHRFSQDSERKLRKNIISYVRNEIMKFDAQETDEIRRKKFSEIWTILAKGTFTIFPFFYSSILNNADIRLDFRLVDQETWNPYQKTKLLDSPTWRAVSKDALLHSYGRKFIDSLFFVSQSRSRIVSADLQRELADAKASLENIKHAAQQSTISKSVKAWAIALGKNVTPVRSHFKFNILQSEKERFLKEIDFSKLVHWVKFEEYLQHTKIRFSNIVQKQANRKAQDIFNTFHRQASVRQCFTGPELRKRIDLNDFMEKFREAYIKIGEDVRKIAIGFISKNLSISDLSHNDREFVEQRLKVFPLETEFSEIVKSILGSEFEFVFPNLNSVAREENILLAENKIREEILTQIQDSIVEFSTHLLNFPSNTTFRHDFRSEQEKDKLDFVMKIIQSSFDDFYFQFKEKVLVPSFQRVFNARKKFLISNIFNRNNGVLVQIVKAFLTPLQRVRKIQTDTIANATHTQLTVDFIRNRLNEFEKGSLKNNQDSVWFECWARMKFILSSFYFSLNVEELNNLLEGHHLSPFQKLTRIGSMRLNVGRPKIMQLDEVLNFTESYEGKSAKLDDGQDTINILVDSDFDRMCNVVILTEKFQLKTRNLHRRLAQSNIESLFSSLILAFRKMVNFDFCSVSDRDLVLLWKKLIESIFPVREQIKQTGVATEQVDEDENNVKNQTPSESLFKQWFDIELDDFLKSPEPLCVTPYLMAISEMVSTPILIKMGDDVFIVEPLIRVPSKDERGLFFRAYTLLYHVKAGFDCWQMTPTPTRLLESLEAVENENFGSTKKKVKSLLPHERIDIKSIRPRYIKDAEEKLKGFEKSETRPEFILLNVEPKSFACPLAEFHRTFNQKHFNLNDDNSCLLKYRDCVGYVHYEEKVDVFSNQNDEAHYVVLSFTGKNPLKRFMDEVKFLYDDE